MLLFFPPGNSEIPCTFQIPQTINHDQNIPTNSQHFVDHSEMIRQRLEEAYGEGYQAAVQAGVCSGSPESLKEQLIEVQEKVIARLYEEKDQIECLLHMREKEWYNIGQQMVSEIEVLREAYSRLINECAHENIRLSGHAYHTMLGALYSNEKALSSSVELQMKLNEQKLHVLGQELYISRLERRVTDLEERLSSILEDGGCGDETKGHQDVLDEDRKKYARSRAPDSHHVLIKNFEFCATDGNAQTRGVSKSENVPNVFCEYGYCYYCNKLKNT